MAKDYKIKVIQVPRFKEENGFYTTAQRSKAMSKIRGKNTKPEIALRKALWALNIKYRINVSTFPGKPDILIRKHKLAIFVDGEFWHGYNWEEKKTKIKTNTAFWIPKIERNIQRDKENYEKLTALGFTVFRFWEHEIKKDLNGCLEKLTTYLKIKESL